MIHEFKTVSQNTIEKYSFGVVIKIPLTLLKAKTANKKPKRMKENIFCMLNVCM